MAHGHSHGVGVSSRFLGFSILFTLIFVVGEATAGYFANSLALLSDAAHNFTDALALVLSWYAIRTARRPAHSRRTYGYHRVSILVALANSVSLIVIALFIFWEALTRIQSPEPVQSGVMIGVAAAAIVLNGIISWGLRADAKHDINIRSAYLHMLGDALSALGVVIAGMLVRVSGASVWDTVVSLLIGALILWSSWDVLRETIDILLEGTPRHIDMNAVEASIRSVSGVLNTHDLHVWTVTSGMIAFSCHIVVSEQSVRSGEQVLRAVIDMLRVKFGIGHSTIQIEVEGCEPNEMYCTMKTFRAEKGHDHDHGHDDHEHGHKH